MSTNKKMSTKVGLKGKTKKYQKKAKNIVKSTKKNSQPPKPLLKVLRRPPQNQASKQRLQTAHQPVTE